MGFVRGGVGWGVEVFGEVVEACLEVLSVGELVVGAGAGSGDEAGDVEFGLATGPDGKLSGRVGVSAGNPGCGLVTGRAEGEFPVGAFGLPALAAVLDGGREGGEVELGHAVIFQEFVRLPNCRRRVGWWGCSSRTMV